MSVFFSWCFILFLPGSGSVSILPGSGSVSILPGSGSVSKFGVRSWIWIRIKFYGSALLCLSCTKVNFTSKNLLYVFPYYENNLPFFLGGITMSPATSWPAVEGGCYLCSGAAGRWGGQSRLLILPAGPAQPARLPRLDRGPAPPLTLLPRVPGQWSHPPGSAHVRWSRISYIC